jgi:hypothetical protein
MIQQYQVVFTHKKYRENNQPFHEHILTVLATSCFFWISNSISHIMLHSHILLKENNYKLPLSSKLSSLRYKHTRYSRPDDQRYTGQDHQQRSNVQREKNKIHTSSVDPTSTDIPHLHIP